MIDWDEDQLIDTAATGEAALETRIGVPLRALKKRGTMSNMLKIIARSFLRNLPLELVPASTGIEFFILFILFTLR